MQDILFEDEEEQRILGAFPPLTVEEAVRQVLKTRDGGLTVAVPPAEQWGGEPSLDGDALTRFTVLVSALKSAVRWSSGEKSGSIHSACEMLRGCALACAKPFTGWFFESLGRAIAYCFVLPSGFPLSIPPRVFCGTVSKLSEAAMFVLIEGTVTTRFQDAGFRGGFTASGSRPAVATVVLGKAKVDYEVATYISLKKAREGIAELEALGLGATSPFYNLRVFATNAAYADIVTEFWKPNSHPYEKIS